MVIKRLPMTRIPRGHQPHLVGKKVFNDLPSKFVGNQPIPSHEEADRDQTGHHRTHKQTPINARSVEDSEAKKCQSPKK